MSNENETKQNMCDKLWSELKDKKIEMFSLPPQPLSSFCKPAIVDPTKLYLLPTASSLLPGLETALGNAYKVELVDKYIVVSKA